MPHLTGRRCGPILRHENKSDTQLFEAVPGGQSRVAVLVAAGRASADIAGVIFTARMHVNEG